MNLKLFSILLVFFLSPHQSLAESFKAQQMKFVRCRSAAAEKGAIIKGLFSEKGLPYPPKRIFIRVFKDERLLELWAGKSNKDTFKLLKEYRICSLSGDPGPKRQQGDGQVPEGFYYINHFNPTSRFHLSLKINYPNEADKILGVRGNLGGDIFIHGSCVTIGCIPITDDGIKELYLIAVEARSAGQTRIPVHIFPTRLNEGGMQYLKEKYGNNALLGFWNSLKAGYDFFEKNHVLPVVKVDEFGGYKTGAQ